MPSRVPEGRPVLKLRRDLDTLRQRVLELSRALPSASGSGEPGPMGPTGPAGPTGLTGPVGPAGPAGEVWWWGTAAPDYTVGAVGDWHLNTATWDVSEKVSAEVVGAWAARGNIKGATGATGPTGPEGPQGPEGPAGTVYVAPYFRATRSTSTTRAAGSTTVLGWNGTVTTRGGVSFTTNTCTPGSSGLWRFEALVTGNWDNWPSYLELRLSGAVVARGLWSDNLAGDRSMYVTWLGMVGVLDTIEVFLGIHGSSATGITAVSSTNAETFFQGYRISD